MTRYSNDYILVMLDGERRRLNYNRFEYLLEQQSGYEPMGSMSIMIESRWFDYIGTQDGDRIYQERKQ